MLDKFYITPGQWRHILRWTLYTLLFLATLMLQAVVLGKDGMFGCYPDPVGVVIICVATVEGPERGGLFALLTSTFWALSGIDQGPLLILCLTALPILSGYLCRRIFSVSYLPSLISCGLILFVTETSGFFLKRFFEAVPGSLFLTQVLPGILVSLLFQPLFYWLVKSIQKIGDPYEAT